MNNSYPFFKYVSEDSKIHNMNSRMKIIWLLLVLIAIILINDYVSLLLLTVFLILVMANTKIKPVAYLSNTLLVWPLYPIALVVVFSLTFNIALSILMTFKLTLIIILFLILTFTTSLSEIAWGFECVFIKLKKLKIPVSKISLRIAMDIKFISNIFEQAKTVKKSMAYRGISYNERAFKTFRKMIIPVISLSHKLSRRMVKSMKLRFYGNKIRTNYHENKVTFFDKLLVIIPLVLIYIVIWLGWC